MLSTLGVPMLRRPRRPLPPSAVGVGRMRVPIRCRTVLPLTSRDREERARAFNGEVISVMPAPNGGHLGFPLGPAILPPTLSPSSVTAEPALALPATPADPDARDPLANPRGVDGGVSPKGWPAAGGGPMSKGDGPPPREVRTTAANRRCINPLVYEPRRNGKVTRSSKIGVRKNNRVTHTGGRAAPVTPANQEVLCQC